MSCKVQQSVFSDCVTYVKSRIKFNTFNTFNNVLKVFPMLNRDWLLYGKGAMRHNKPTKKNERNAITVP